MEDKPHVLLLGSSVFIDGISESLLKQNKSVITRMNVNVYEAKDALFALKPDMVIYELGKDISAPLFTTANENTNISHLAIDLNDKLIFLFHYKCEPTSSMQELCDFISNEIDSKNKQTEPVKKLVIE